MVSTLRNRNFSLFWVGQLISLTGDWVFFIALPFYIYQLTGSALATGAMFIAETIPSVLLGSMAGVFADRWDRRRTMIIADLLRALALLPVLAVRSAEGVWVVYVSAFVLSSISQFFYPAKNALIPQLVGEHDLVAANSLSALTDSLTRLVGPALGGALLGMFGPTIVVLADVVSFLISALLLSLMALPTRPMQAARQTRTGAPRWSSVWGEWLDGLTLVKKNRMLTGLFLVAGIMFIGQGTINALLVVFVREVFHGGAQEFGWIATAQGIGGVVGGIWLGQRADRLRPMHFITYSTGLLGLGLLFITNVPVYWLALVLISPLGLLVAGWMISTQTLLQAGVVDQFRGRVFGSFNMTLSVMMLVGMALASGLGDRLGVVLLFDVAGFLHIGAALIAIGLIYFYKPQAQVTGEAQPA